MPIPATKPTTVPATSEVVYDKWWVAQIMVQAQDPKKPVRFLANLKKFALINNEVVFGPDDAVIINIPNLFNLAGKNQKVKDAMDALMAAIEDYGASENLL
jgi:hypothetical protein